MNYLKLMAKAKSSLSFSYKILLKSGVCKGGLVGGEESRSGSRESLKTYILGEKIFPFYS